MALVTAAQTATVVVRNRKGITKIVSCIILAIVFPAFVIFLSLLELVAAFTPDGVVPSSGEMDVTSTAVYREIRVATEPFYNDLWTEMGQLRNEIMAEHTDMVTLYDDEGDPYETERCDVIVTRHMDYLGDAYLISYLVCAQGLDINTANINETVAYEFLDSICDVVVIQGNYEYEIVNSFMTLEQIVAMYFPNESDANRFMTMCEVYSQFMQISSSSIDIEAGNWTNEDFSAIRLMDVPLYLQYRGIWAGIPYGNGTIKKNGCAPTCLAMVLSYVRQEEILPNDVVAWAGNSFYVNGVGTSWDIFNAVEGSWGVRCTNIGKNQQLMIQALRDGKPVIASMGPGTFTRAGHFIVLSGITLDGRIMVKDPNDSAMKNHANTSFDVGLILRESKNLWVCE